MSTQKTNQPSSIMEQLLASSSLKPKIFYRGEQVEGKILALTDTDVIIDLGTKAEGVLSRRDLAPEKLERLKPGDTLQAFVLIPESESGQTILSIYKQSDKGGKWAVDQAKKWRKFLIAYDQKKQLKGRAVEMNKGGLVVDIEGVRGFLPSSHISLGYLSNLGNLNDLIGREFPVTVLEVDPENNKLILSSRLELDEGTKVKLDSFKVGEEVLGKVAGILPFGLSVNLDGAEGVVFSQEVSWETGEDWNQEFKVGQEVKAKITGKDDTLGRLNLSIRQLTQDPFEEIFGQFQTDDVVSGVVTEVTQNGIKIQLDKGIEGYVTPGKIEHGITYEAGQKTNFLVESVDKKNRRINLAPFITSTVGLIYK